MTASITEAEPSDSRPSESKLLILAFAFAAAWGMMQLFVVKQVPLDLTWLGIGLTSFVFAEFLFAVTYPITDVVTAHFNSDMSSADAVAMLADAVANSL